MTPEGGTSPFGESFTQLGPHWNRLSVSHCRTEGVYLIQNMEIPICMEDFMIFVSVSMKFVAKAGNFPTPREERLPKKINLLLSRTLRFLQTWPSSLIVNVVAKPF